MSSELPSGADFGYIGSAFIATHEARASDAYKQAIVDGNSDDIPQRESTEPGSCRAHP